MSNGIRVGSYVYTDGWGTKTPKSDKSPEERKAAKAEYQKAYMPGYAAEHREELRANVRRCMPPLSELIPGYVPMSARQQIPPPPCGGDCESGCPYDECSYPDWDEEHSKYYIQPSNGQKISREARQRGKKKYDANLKQRRKENPKLDADVRAKKRGYSAKHRAKVKFVKAGGTPEEFERKWRRDHE